MKIAIYPGSFNPWHEGHTDILNKALKCFDQVIISVGFNPEKELSVQADVRAKKIKEQVCDGLGDVLVDTFSGLLVDHVSNHVIYNTPEHKVCAIVRGLRNGHDLQYEMNQYFWNQDLGLEIPIVYFICDRTLSHISSSTIKMVKALTDGKISKTEG
jgi:pantetheine-phosphate adenylyltransferase